MFIKLPLDNVIQTSGRLVIRIGSGPFLIRIIQIYTVNVKMRLLHFCGMTNCKTNQLPINLHSGNFFRSKFLPGWRKDGKATVLEYHEAGKARGVDKQGRLEELFTTLTNRRVFTVAEITSFADPTIQSHIYCH